MDAVPIPARNGISNTPAEQLATRPLQRTEEACVKSHPPQGAFVADASYHCILAVQNARGFLIPVFTGRDLLFELRKIWRI
jgi:hypothetical protein